MVVIVGRWNHSPRGISKSLNVASLSSRTSHVESRSRSLYFILETWPLFGRQSIYCGKTIQLHAFIPKPTACSDDCPLFRGFSKDHRPCWRFFDLLSGNEFSICKAKLWNKNHVRTKTLGFHFDISVLFLLILFIFFRIWDLYLILWEKCLIFAHDLKCF